MSQAITFTQLRRALEVMVGTENFLQLSGGRNSETVFQKVYVYIQFFLVLLCRLTFCRFSRAFFIYIFILKNCLN
jgi:hypothetical protein